MHVRPFAPADLRPVVQLFTATVHFINSRDYTPEQIAAWSPPGEDWPRWQRRFAGLRTLVAEQPDGKLLGFTAFTAAGYLDFLFVHHEHQRRGVARALVNAAEAELRAAGVRRVTVHASITALPFFQALGYVLLERHQFEKDGVLLTNFAMDKDLRGE